MSVPPNIDPPKSHTWPTYRRLLGFAKPYRWRLILGILAGLLSGGSAFGALQMMPRVLAFFDAPEKAPEQLRFVGELAERVKLGELAVDQNQALDFRLLIVGSSLLVGLFFLKSLFVFINRYFMGWVGARVIMDLRNRLFGSLQKQSLAFYGQTDVGQLISRCISDTQSVEHAVSSTIADLSRAPIEIVAAISVILLQAWENDIYMVPVALFVVLPAILGPIVLLGRKVRSYFQKSLERISDLVSRMHENFTGIRVVKAFHMEEAETKRFFDINQTYFNHFMGAWRAALMMSPLVEFVAVALICAFLVYSWKEQVLLSQIMSMITAVIFAYDPLKRLTRVVPQVQRSVAAADRIFALIDVDTALPEKPNAAPLSEFQREVVFENVSLQYNVGEDRPPVIKGASFTIGKGQIVAVVGKTGSGKTSLASLLARFFDPTEGRVLIDGIDLREVQLASLRRLVGVVTQETILFNDTIANNIAYGSPEATHEDIVEAARKANAHEFIVAEDQGYSRVIGEKGFVLSGGQRQRLAIARVILRNPQILILDEATSALDTVTEKLVQDALTKLMRDRTVFAIAHRLSTIRQADQILVLDEGRIIERGRHEELLAQGGAYEELHRMQQLD